MASSLSEIRNARIASNMQRLQELGIADLSKSMADDMRPKKSQNKRKPPSRDPEAPPRRSARVKDLPSPVYKEVRELARARVSQGRDAHTVGKGDKPEVYTEEHEKLLGNAVNEWPLRVDGYNNGRRVYGSGSSCHQCRQKTEGLRTSCSRCKSGHGQFCGDCLYTRYGENVLEVLEDSKWICPPCRDICNCSRCRKAKGWEGTKQCYHAVVKLGYKSVAHFLIKTRRAGAPAVEVPADDGIESGDENPAGGSSEKSEPEPEVIVLDENEVENELGVSEDVKKASKKRARKAKAAVAGKMEAVSEVLDEPGLNAGRARRRVQPPRK